jgi:hypothetical protein
VNLNFFLSRKIDEQTLLELQQIIDSCPIDFKEKIHIIQSNTEVSSDIELFQIEELTQFDELSNNNSELDICELDACNNSNELEIS